MSSNERSKILKNVVPEIGCSLQLSGFQMLKNLDSTEHQMKDDRILKNAIIVIL